MNLKYCYAAVTLDVINEYCFSADPKTVLKPDFGKKEFDDIDSFLEMSIRVGAPKFQLHLCANMLCLEPSRSLVHGAHSFATCRPY